MSHPLLNRHIERRTLKPVYLFFGEEEFLMQRALERLEEAIAAQGGEPPTREVWEAEDIKLADFLATAREGTLWGAGKLLILRGVEAYAADELKALSGYLEHPASRTWLVLLSGKLKAREVEKHAVWGRLQRNEAALGFSRLREGDLYQWLTREAQQLGKSLTLAAAQRLVAMAGDNLFELSRELEKLALYAGEERTLTPALVSQLASHSRTYTIFALVEAIGEPGAHKRLAALDQLLDLGEAPVKILAMLARQVRLLLRVKEGGQNSPPELARSLRLPPGIIKKLGVQAARFSAGSLRSYLVLLHQADQQIKTSTGNPRLWLEWALLKMGPAS
jgi:DNA polymerase III subunit delta